ncbi:hypothetical protein BJ165DRAFT_1492615 [Panaeolus papilionaceus]|nr:hypothetical protein BJ165DRAFT_1492615 [Panaeolus papilionaceus]
MGFSKLPLELTDIILGYLFPPNTKPDKKLLVIIAGCNVALNGWAAPRIFRDIVIRIQGQDKSLETFRQILDGRPVIATLVTSFTLHIRRSSRIGDNPTKNPIYRDTHIPIILPQLQNLTHFALKGGSLPDYSPIDWDLFSKSWVEAVQNVCLLPSITSIELCNSCLLKSGWITHCKNLKDLGMWGVIESFGDPQGLHPWKDLDASTIPRLERLRLDKITSCIDTLYRLDGLQSLKKLDVALSREQFVGTVRGIIEGASDTLEELGIYRFNESPFQSIRYDFPSWTPLPALRHLTIHISYAHTFDEIPLWAEYIHPLIRRFPPTCQALNTLTLIAGESWRFLGPPKLYMPSEAWILLEQFCATTYPSLRTLVLVFEDSSLPSEDAEDADSDLEDDDPLERCSSQPGSDEEDREWSGMKGPVDASERFGITSFTVFVEVKPLITHL